MRQVCGESVLVEAVVVMCVTCENALGLGRRCISVFVTGATTVRLIEYWSACTFA